ncbi:hypothetical protein STRDD10_01645 [Streptococcus sp. DD10]|uniref:hypothetical protein n=1 Tax=Streptococcus sp. DD10 TaxID=1777878 RepID=UPI0007937726|nr:hypothetical protein [Streptococcus sp. DD10]KXT73049.1 hypothetical protein STRDD10_01645 [Streptococcus sp. DD10]
MEKFYHSLTLLFLSRQGYWSDSKEVQGVSLTQLTYKYLLSSLGLIFLFAIAKEEVYSILKNYRMWNLLSYFELAQLLVPAILVLGIVYENIYVLTTKTMSTMKLFFNISDKEFFGILLVKNFIIVSPLLVIISFYNIVLGSFSSLLILLLNGVVYFSNIRLFSLKHKTSYNLSYIFSVMDIWVFLKTLLAPVFSTIVFMFMLVFVPQLLKIEITHNIDILSTALFSGTVFFGSRGLNFYFLSLNKDLPYLQAIQIDLKNFIKVRVGFLSIISWGLPAVSITIFLWYVQYSILQISIFLLGMLFAYLLCQSTQFIEALIFKQYEFKDAKELDAFSLPIKTRVILYFVRLIPVLVVLLFNQIRGIDFMVLALLNAVYITAIFYTSYRYMLSNIIKGENRVHFIY